MGHRHKLREGKWGVKKAIKSKVDNTGMRLNDQQDERLRERRGGVRRLKASRALSAAVWSSGNFLGATLTGILRSESSLGSPGHSRISLGSPSIVQNNPGSLLLGHQPDSEPLRV
ncbi:hypothetical protein NDU88_008318 [Pleurodeles waltl]|uniref:Uncharacterized protein n=1 Tax=Pleurodeles waltl TaxID=8319 RepID=A0AAV7PVV0_PLEWA|nr:hypothetical protein NDU88_008318 [Pleurodeles waltl]